MDGFTLKITNPPAGAVLWNANFAGNSFNYDPLADSGWLRVDETWEYPYNYDKQGNPLYCTTLKIWILDASNNILLDIENLGPIEAGKNYVFDCATVEIAAPSTLIGSMIGMMMVVMMMTMMMKSMQEG